MRGLAVLAIGALALAGCTNPPDEHPGGRELRYPTHCGVGQVHVGGVMYYPTGIYEDGELVASGQGGDLGGPTPWESLSAPNVSDPNNTYGVVVVADDGSAEFFVNDTDYSVRLSDDKADAAWYIEGCA